MNKNDVIRAWKDPLYRATLSTEAQAALPQNPAGITELRDDQLVAGASVPLTTALGCTEYTFHGWASCCPTTA